MDFSDKPSFWKALKPPAKDKCGELLCSLCYHPSNSVLTLTLLKARNLKAKDINGKSGERIGILKLKRRPSQWTYMNAAHDALLFLLASETMLIRSCDLLR